MNKVLSVILAAFLVSILAGCQSVTPGPGEEGVIVRYPRIFKMFYVGGVDPTPVTSGREYIALTTDSYIVDVKPMQFLMSIDDMFSKDNVPLDFTAAMRLRVTDSVRLVRDFGVSPVGLGNGEVVPAWYANNVFKPWDRTIRQFVKSYGMSDLVADTVIEGRQSSVIEEIDKATFETMVAYFESIDLPVQLIDITIGRATPPVEIKDERVATATQDQRSNTEIRRKLAEDQRKKAEESRAGADNAYRQMMQLSPSQFLQLEQVKMMREVCGTGKCTFLVGAGGVTPVLDLNR